MKDLALNKLYLLAIAASILIIVMLSMTAFGKTVNTELLDFDQFDSLCINDSIPRDLYKWEIEETADDRGKIYRTFTFHKFDSITNTSQTTYDVELLDDGIFQVTKTNW